MLYHTQRVCVDFTKPSITTGYSYIVCQFYKSRLFYTFSKIGLKVRGECDQYLDLSQGALIVMLYNIWWSVTFIIHWANIFIVNNFEFVFSSPFAVSALRPTIQQLQWVVRGTSCWDTTSPDLKVWIQKYYVAPLRTIEIWNKSKPNVFSFDARLAVQKSEFSSTTAKFNLQRAIMFGGGHGGASYPAKTAKTDELKHGIRHPSLHCYSRRALKWLLVKFEVRFYEVNLTKVKEIM